MGDSGDEELYPLAVLIDELKNDDPSQRLIAIHRLPTIALALGEARTRSELISFLTSNETIDEDDELLLALAEELGQFGPLVGGPAHITSLLPAMERLCQVEETVVRDTAVRSLVNLTRDMDTSCNAAFLAMVDRLGSADWFTSRVSAALLMACAYRLSNDARRPETQKLYIKLIHDDTPMVRRASAQVLEGVLGAIELSDLTEILVEYVNLLNDNEDSVRLLALQSSLSQAHLVVQMVIEGHGTVLNTMRNSAMDRSWKVRNVFAKMICTLQAALAKDVAKDELVPIFTALLTDPESEVKANAVQQLPAFIEALDASVQQSTANNLLLPIIKDLVSDQAQNVRSAIAVVLVSMAGPIGKDRFAEDFLPYVKTLLRDEFSEVQLNVINNIHSVSAVVGTDLVMSAIVPTITELAEDRQWRVRMAVIEYLPVLAKQIGETAFDEKLIAMSISFLADCVYAIREAASVNLRRLIECFGTQWATKELLPKVILMAASPSYLHRMTVLITLSKIAKACTGPIINSVICPAALTLVKDKVPNVRFNAALTLGTIASLEQTEKRTTEQVADALNQLKEDNDPDVKYFANEGLVHC